MQQIYHAYILSIQYVLIYNNSYLELIYYNRSNWGWIYLISLILILNKPKYAVNLSASKFYIIFYKSLKLIMEKEKEE
jgi:hypothetical protein